MAHELELKKLEVTMNGRGNKGGKSGGVKTPRLPIFQDGKDSLDEVSDVCYHPEVAKGKFGFKLECISDRASFRSVLMFICARS